MATLLDNLISYWKLDEASGNALDAHGSNDLTDNNSVGSAAGKINTARDFEFGSSQYFRVASNATLQTGDVDFTLAAWVKLESKPATAARILSKFGNNASAPNVNEFVLSFGTTSDRFEFAVCESGGSIKVATADALGSPSLATWYFVVAWYDKTNDTANICVNDGTVNQTTGVAAPAATNAGFNMGCLFTGVDGSPIQFFDGLIDEAGYWKRLLSAAEITSLYNADNGFAYPWGVGPMNFYARRARSLSGGLITMGV